MNNPLGEKIKAAREARAWDQSELAKEVLGKASNQAQISRWESGRNLPSSSNLLKLARVLNFSLEDITHV